MKQFSIIGTFLLLMGVSICCASCSNKDNEPEIPYVTPYVVLSKTIFNIDSKAQTISVIAKTNVQELEIWVPDEYPWIRLSEVSDQGTDKLCVFQIENNTDAGLRSGSVTIMGVSGDSRCGDPFQINQSGTE